LPIQYHFPVLRGSDQPLRKSVLLEAGRKRKRYLVLSVAYPPAHSVAARTGLSRQTEALSGRFIEIEVPLSGIPVLTQAPPEATSDIARCARKKPAALD
jgi:hypothetical protein